MSNMRQILKRGLRTGSELRMLEGGDTTGMLARMQSLNGATSPTATPVGAPIDAAHDAQVRSEKMGMATGLLNSFHPLAVPMKNGGQLRLKVGGGSIFDAPPSASRYSISAPAVPAPEVEEEPVQSLGSQRAYDTTYGTGRPYGTTPAFNPANRAAYPGQGAPGRGAPPAWGRTPLPATGAGAGQGLRGTPPVDYAIPAAGARSAASAGEGLTGRAAFLARNPGVAANYIASPSAPVPSAPVAPAGTSRVGTNTFGDASAAYNAVNPQTAVHGTTTMQEWSAPGRSNGRPTEQDMFAAGNVGNPANSMFANVRAAAAPDANKMDPLGAPYRGMKDVNFNPNPGTFRAPLPMKNGGSLRTGMGGEVPGTGHGDKIPAKYEPGEFVVSNDMLDADPTLQPKLDALREHVLAQKGMTPEQADAKAIHGMGLRANDSFSSRSDMRMPQDRYPTRAVGPSTIEPYPAVAPDPRVMTQGVDGVSPPGQRYPGRGLVPVGNAAPVVDGRAVVTTADTGRGFTQGPSNLGRDPNTIYQGNNTSGKFNLATRPIGPNVVDVESKIVPPKGGAPMPPNAGPSNGQAAGYRAGKSVAGALRSTMGRAVPIVSGGLELADGIDKGDGWGVAKGAGDMVAGAALATPAAPLAATYLGLRGLYEGAKAAAPYVSDYIFDHSEAGKKAAALNAPAAPVKAAPKEQDFTAANAAKIAAANAAEGPAKLGDIRNVDPEAGTQDVFTQGAWKTVSTPEAKAARRLREQEWTAKQEKETADSRADLARQAAYFSKAAGTDDESRMLEGLGPNHRAAALNQLLATKASLRNAELNADTQIKTTGMNNEASIYGHNLTNRLGIANALREQANKNREFAAGRYDKGLEQSATMDKQARDALKFYGRDKDGKPYEDPQLGNAAYELLQRQNPNWSQLSSDKRAALLTDAKTHVDLINNLRDHQNNSWWQAIGLGNKDVTADHLPSLKGAKLSEVGIVDGATTPNAARGDYKLTVGGKDFYLGRDQVSSDHLTYMKRNGVHIPGDK